MLRVDNVRRHDEIYETHIQYLYTYILHLGHLADVLLKAMSFQMHHCASRRGVIIAPLVHLYHQLHYTQQAYGWLVCSAEGNLSVALELLQLP